MPQREIDPGLVEATKAWLGKDGSAFFKMIHEEHGRMDAVFKDGPIPHPVHFREGMQVRNFMRSTEFCKDWSDHDFDDSWISLVEQCVLENTSQK